MPKLTDLVAGRVDPANRDECPRCQRRKATVYIHANARKRISKDPETETGTRLNAAKKTVCSVKGETFCRVCAREVVEQIAQLLGTEVRDGEAD